MITKSASILIRSQKSYLNPSNINFKLRSLSTYPVKVIPNDVRDGLIETIGNTPLIKLRKLSEATGCNVSIEFRHANACS
jgi:hypothetical protein